MDHRQLTPSSEGCFPGSSWTEDEDCEESQGQMTVEEICGVIDADPTMIFLQNQQCTVASPGLDSADIPIIDTTNCGDTLEPLDEEHSWAFEVRTPPDVIASEVIVTTTVVEEPLDEAPLDALHQSTLPSEEKISGTEMKRKAKENRVLGNPYTGFRRKDKKSTNKIIHDVNRECRKIGPPCASPKCRQWSKRSCSSVSLSDREFIFNQFWKNMTTWAEKKTYVCSTVRVEPTKQKTVKGKESRHTSTYLYNLKIQDRSFPVGREMYLNTLGLKRTELHYWISNFHLNDIPSSRNLKDPSVNHEQAESDKEDDHSPTVRPAKNLSVAAFNQAADHLNRFLDALPTLPSHYCRKNSSKLYLQTDIRSWNQLYDIYMTRCIEKNVQPVSKFTFRKIRVKKNIDIHQPKKDKCDLCCSYELGHVSQDIYDAHRLNKESARQEKEMDKAESIKGSCHTLCFDLMMVQPLPRLRAASAYYKLKLTAHCFTVYNLKTHDCMAYWFDETEVSLNATTFASCLWEYLEELLEESTKTVILYSDGCCYQNRNSVLSNALLHLSMLKKVTIIQKFLEKGHTQMECDSAHSTIERKINNIEVHLTSQYASLTEVARKTPMPYRSKMIDHKFVKNFGDTNHMIYPTIRPGRKSGDPTVTNLRWLQYEPTGQIKYKLAFQDELRDLPHRPKTVKPLFPPAYTSRPSIPMDKYTDLQALKTLMPSDTHEWYDAIPHEDESRRKLKRKV
ncbi:Hypothetical protein NTJ_03889 [Nesidiocoris tenuis]|uniref:DUF7869 domain-containing protein n=2 Tax=Nesidiocoris tenuis TaxID=355587 RepID=A0ABN7AIQ2_9HEMI|nr:Hypothetical protein NTJ_03889 [Nesidiocoris tenuis]